MSAPAHVLVLRPIIERLEAEGHQVEITARDYAQTLALLELHGMPHTEIGRHGGASRLRKAPVGLARVPSPNDDSQAILPLPFAASVQSGRPEHAGIVPGMRIFALNWCR